MAATPGNYESKSANEIKNSLGGSHSGSASERVTDDVGKLRNDISNLADSVRQLASEKVGTTAGDVQVKAQEKLGELESMIRRNPSQSALIAAGVGFVVGLILSR